MQEKSLSAILYSI